MSTELIYHSALKNILKALESSAKEKRNHQQARMTQIPNIWFHLWNLAHEHSMVLVVQYQVIDVATNTSQY